MWPLARAASRLRQRTSGAQAGLFSHKVGICVEACARGGGDRARACVPTLSARMLRESSLARMAAAGGGRGNVRDGRNGTGPGSLRSGVGGGLDVDGDDVEGESAADGGDGDDADDDDDERVVWPRGAEVVDFDSFDPGVLHIMPLGGYDEPTPHRISLQLRQRNTWQCHLLKLDTT